MRGSKRGPHKCFKTLTDRLTPKYVCPSKGKAGITALSTMGTRPERAAELEALGEVRKPPKQQREMESDPIALLDQKEKIREQRHLLRMKNHPQTLHAEESQEAVQQKPDTLHYETDEEAVEKALNEVLDLLEEEIRVHAATPRFSSLCKSLIIITDLNKAEAPPPTESSQNLSSFLKDNDIKPGETFKRYFKRKKIDIDKFDKHTKEHDAAHSISPGAFTLNNSRDAFLHTPIDSLYRTYKGELGKVKLNSKLNLIKVTLDHYNSLSGNSAYKGSDIEKYKKEQMAQVSSLESGLESLRGGKKKGPAFTKPTAFTSKDVKRGIQREKREKIRGAWAKQFPKRLSMLTEEGREKKLKGVALTGEALLWLMPTTVGMKILSGGAKFLAPKTMQALSSIVTRLIGGGKGAEGSRKAFVTALEPLVAGAGSSKGRALINATIQTASKGRSVGQVISITQGASKLSPVASIGGGGGGAAATATARQLVPEVASKTAPLLSVVPEVAPAIGSAKEGVAAGAGFSSWLLSQYLRGKKESKTEGVKAPKHKPQVKPEFIPPRRPKVKPTPEVGAPPLKKEKEVSELKQEPTSKTEIKTEPLPETDPGGKRKGRRRTRRRKRREGKIELLTMKPKRAIDDETKKLPKRKKTPSSVASAEERTEDATRQREKKRGKMERGVEEASKKAAARRNQERYQTIGVTSKKFAQVVRKSVSTMEEYKALYKSKSYLAPVVRQVLNKRISLKEALDKVPWHMQAELLEQLHKRA